jgi:hypothetical protein
MALTGVLVLAPGTSQQLDLTPYLAVDDDSLNPSDPQFTQKQWSHSLLREGGTEALEHLDLKGTVWPLRLRASTRDALNALVESINNLVNTPGMVVSWQDVGSSQPTYFDLASGILTPKYDFRKAGQQWLPAELQLFFQPLGRTATTRLVASAAGTGPLLMLPIPSAILGDAGALMHAQVICATGPHQFAVSVLPAGYQAEFLAASMSANGVLSGGSGAVASQFIRSSAAPAGALPNIGVATLPSPTPYFGPNRLLAVARTSSTATNYLKAALLVGSMSISLPTTVLVATTGFPGATTAWQLVDLGTFTIPSSAQYPNAQLFVTAGVPSTGATQTVDLTDLIVLPDSNTMFVDSNASPFTSTVAGGTRVYDVDGIALETSLLNTSGQLLQRFTSLQRGLVPKLPPTQQASSQIAVLLLGDAGNGVAQTSCNFPLSAGIQVRERVRFAF